MAGVKLDAVKKVVSSSTVPAGVAWLLWGGSAGRAWFRRVLRAYRGA